MNKVILIGNVCREPDIHTTQSGLLKASFSMAIQRRFANQQGVREADFIPVVAWRQLAELCQKYVTKGKKLAVVGTLQVRSYDDPKTQQKRVITEVVADEIEFLSPRQSESQTSAAAAVVEDDAPDEMIETDTDGLPF